MTTQRSDVARLRQEIEASYEAAMRVFESPGITAPHRFITARMERISDIEAELVGLVGADEATRITIEAMKGSGDVACHATVKRVCHEATFQTRD